MPGIYVASNSGSLLAQTNLSRTQTTMNNVMLRLTTGLRINTAKDDPAGLFASTYLKRDMTGTSQAIRNTNQATNMVAVADSALGNIALLLNDMKGLVLDAANDGTKSADIIAADQLQIDAAIDMIDRIAKTTIFQGRRLLDGTLDFNIANKNAAGAPIAAGAGTYSERLSDLKVTQANFGMLDHINLEIAVKAAATQAEMLFKVSETAGSIVDRTNGTFSFTVAGSKGSQTFTFTANVDTVATPTDPPTYEKLGITDAEYIKAINQFADVTGIHAVAASGGGMKLFSAEEGSEQFVDIRINSAAPESDVAGGITLTDNAATPVAANRTYGKDACVTINGNTVVAQGRNLSYQTPTLAFTATLTPKNIGYKNDGTAIANPNTMYGNKETSTPAAPTLINFRIESGGATFQLGANVVSDQQSRVGFANVSSSKLGGNSGYLFQLKSGGSASLINNARKADSIITDAISSISTFRASLGALQKYSLEMNQAVLEDTLVQLTAAEADISNADFASETSNLVRQQVLMQSGAQALKNFNMNPQYALALL